VLFSSQNLAEVDYKSAKILVVQKY